ncbi:MAG: hypothetical protein IJ367_02095, partial [Clostridia bacterium]|nr:hypothetical protein [Clostridia bacterium]
MYALTLEYVGDSFTLYKKENGTTQKVTEADTSGTYLVKYAQSRTESGTMIAAAYHSGRLASVASAAYSAGSYSVTAELSNVPAGSTVKAFFIKYTASAAPLKIPYVLAESKTVTPRDLYVSPTGSDAGDGT